MEDRDHEKLVEEHLNAWLDELHGRAVKIVEAHLSAVMSADQKMPGWKYKRG